MTCCVAGFADLFAGLVVLDWLCFCFLCFCVGFMVVLDWWFGFGIDSLLIVCCDLGGVVVWWVGLVCGYLVAVVRLVYCWLLCCL